MSVNSKNVFIGAPDQSVTGAILTGEETDVIPATIDDVEIEGLEDSGYVNEDGVTITPSESTETIKDWALNVIRRILTEFDGTIAWTHLELSVGALKNYMGDDNVEVTEATGFARHAGARGDLRRGSADQGLVLQAQGRRPARARDGAARPGHRARRDPAAGVRCGHSAGDAVDVPGQGGQVDLHLHGRRRRERIRARVVIR